MSSLNQLLLLCSLLLVPMARGDGVLDVRILSFLNPSNRAAGGACCEAPESPKGACPAPCTAFVRLCVTDANLTSASGPEGGPVEEEGCRFGLYVSEPSFGGLRQPHHPKNNNLNIAFRFPYPWTGSVGMVLEAWHRTSTLDNVTFVGGVPSRLISRVRRVVRVGVAEGWRKVKEVPAGGSGSSFEWLMRVQCDTAFYGHNCSQMCLDRDNDFGHYTCDARGERACREGWVGPECTQPVCAPGCHPTNGFCSKPNTCQCKLGWRGAMCSECVPLPGCVHGACANQSSFTCECSQGWDGLFCSIPICKEGCHPNRGYCTTPHDCRCRLGWEGELCSSCTPLPGCVRGSCSQPLECNCQEGFRGIFCESPVCSNSCHPLNGFCKEPGECRCRVGWSGSDCEQCVPYPGCKNGNCTLPWECNCEAGWGGLLCDQRLSFCEWKASPCENGGTCLSRSKEAESSYVCACRLGFSGTNCQLKVRD